MKMSQHFGPGFGCGYGWINYSIEIPRAQFFKFMEWLELFHPFLLE